MFPFIQFLPTVQYMSMTSALYLTIFQSGHMSIKADRFVPMLMLIKAGIKMYYESWVLACSKVFRISSQFISLHVLQILIPYSCQSSFLELLSWSVKKGVHLAWCFLIRISWYLWRLHHCLVFRLDLTWWLVIVCWWYDWNWFMCQRWLVLLWYHESSWSHVFLANFSV
jgi:hypothetical protein